MQFDQYSQRSEASREALEKRIQELRVRLREDAKQAFEARARRVRELHEQLKQEAVREYERTVEHGKQMTVAGNMPQRALDIFTESVTRRLEKTLRFQDRLLEDFLASCQGLLNEI